MKRIKHLSIGILIGFMLAFSFSANAETVITEVGKMVDGAFTVKVDGKELDKQAIVVEGTSYLPVRSFGDATGYDISFDPEMGIELTKKKITVKIYNTKKIERIEEDISAKTEVLNFWTEQLNQYKETYKDKNKKADYEENITKLQTIIDNTKAEIERLNKQKAELEAAQ